MFQFLQIRNFSVFSNLFFYNILIHPIYIFFFRLEGKVAVITGGASGIGEGTARLFVRHGAKVVIADIQDTLGHTVCTSLGPAASYIHCDVTKEDDISAAVDHAVSTFGKLDIMYNNAGIGGDTDPLITDNTKANFDSVIAINLRGPFLGIKHAARVMIPAGKGSIISTSSLAGCIGGAASHAYTAAKHGVVGLTKNGAAELGRYGIRVNCVSPAALATPLATDYLKLTNEGLEAIMNSFANLKGVTLKIEDIANAVLFLASDDSKYVSGQNIAVDGGHSVINPAFDPFKVEV